MADGTLQATAVADLFATLRPRLHRYCARIVGSAVDGEDVVQEALAKAAEALKASGPIARPESWLFRIAHNTALDALRRRKRHEPLVSWDDDVADPAAQADARVAAAAALATFLRLPPTQRAAVVLMDVLGHSGAETAEVLDTTTAAVRAALHRGRARLVAIAAEPVEFRPASSPAGDMARLRAYADRFNARDFDALRALLAEDVRLDLANRARLEGRKDVSVYFTRYESLSGWRFAVGLAEGRPALLVSDPAGDLTHIVLIDWADGRIAVIRDFKYAPYVLEGLEVTPA
jgi:RNA polymerase sigma-70 factor (ECF subfamily)